MTSPFPSLTRRDLLVSGAALAGAAGTALAQPASAIPTVTKELWQWARTQPVLDLQYAYLDVASIGPTLRAAMAAEYRARDAQSFSAASFREFHWAAETNRITTRVAALVGCDPDEICFTTGAGSAIGFVAAGLDLAAGDEIVTTTREHPAALSPFEMLARRRGLIVKQVGLPAPLLGPQQALEPLAAALTERTKVLLISHINYADGSVMPVRELCELARQKGVLSIIDGAQALGMIDFWIRDLNCDFYATSFHKWLGGCHGSGLLYVRRDKLDGLWPTSPRGVESSPPLLTPTQAFGQVGVPAALRRLGNVVPYAWPALRGAEAALELQQQIGRARIEARVRELILYARMRLQQLPGIEFLTPVQLGSWAGLLTFRFPGKTAAEIVQSLALGHRVIASELTWPGAANGAVRVSLHMFNTYEEVERLAQGLQQTLR